MEEVVVTGMGCVSSLGNSPDELWSNLLAGKSGVSNVTRFDTSAYAVHFGSEVKVFDASPYYSERDAKRYSRSIQYGVHAAETALKNAGIDPKAEDVTRAGVMLTSGIGGMDTYYETSVVLGTRGPRRVSPFFIPMSVVNMVPGEIAIRLGWMGPNWAPVSACASSNHSIISAVDQIRLGRADIMLAGGAEEAVCPVALSGFASMKALSLRNDAPELASRPFDTDRDGFVVGEGAGALVLESLSHAKKRGAKILARIAGMGVSCDAYHISAPREDGAGIALAVDMAVKSAGLDIQQVGYVNTHGTSTSRGDIAECTALEKAFGGKIDNVKINSTKSMTGHLLGAAGGLEAVVTALVLARGVVPPTINLDTPDDACDLDFIPNQARTVKVRAALSNSFGFGGHNVTLAMKAIG